MLSNKNVSLVLGVGLCLVFLSLTPKSWQTIGSIKDRQIAANLRLIEWKDAYQALLPVNKRWVKTYPDGLKARDIVSLYRLIDLPRHNLITDIDSVSQAASSDVVLNGVDVGLQKLCVGTSGDVMRVEARSIKELREGLTGLSRRTDIDMGEIIFSFNAITQKPVAEIKGVCLKVRVVDDLDSDEEKSAQPVNAVENDAGSGANDIDDIDDGFGDIDGEVEL